MLLLPSLSFAAYYYYDDDDDNYGCCCMDAKATKLDDPFPLIHH